MAGAWVPDILGEPFEQLTLDLGEDAEGPVVATLVRSLTHGALLKPLVDVDVLYVHGWSDYFFQRELARFWNRLGARFFALDLRKYGRSLRAGQTPGYVTSLDEYDDDIEAALAAIAATGPHRGARRLVLMGHSTGGLTLSLWAARHPGRTAALVLNSPWLELQTGAIGRQAIAPLVAARARFDPLGTHPVVDLGFYTRAQTALGTLPESPVEPQPWRPERGFPTHPGWLAAVMKGHASVAAGLDIDCPVLVLLSSGSTPPVQWADTMTSTDSVLVTPDIARAATRLGGLVTVSRIPDAIHDVFLSAPEPTATAYDALRAWSLRGALA